MTSVRAKNILHAIGALSSDRTVVEDVLRDYSRWAVGDKERPPSRLGLREALRWLPNCGEFTSNEIADLVDAPLVPRASRTPDEAPVSDNPMRIWDEVCNSPDEDIRTADDGFSFVELYHKVKKATKLWGPQGTKWRVLAAYTEQQFMLVPLKPIIVRADVVLVYPGGKIRIRDTAWLVDLEGKPNLGAYKQARGKALAKALGELGFNADVRLIRARNEDVDRKAEAQAARSSKPGDDAWRQPIGEGDRVDDAYEEDWEKNFDKTEEEEHSFVDVTAEAPL